MEFMAYDNLVNGSCFRTEKNFTDTIISQCGRHITCDVKGNCCLAFSSVGKRKLNLKLHDMKIKIIKSTYETSWYNDKIGETFDVLEIYDDIIKYKVLYNSTHQFVRFDDCEILN